MQFLAAQQHLAQTERHHAEQMRSQTNVVIVGGSTCRSSLDCGSGEFCKDWSGGRVCMGNGGVGAPCSSGIDCGGSLFCRSGLCGQEPPASAVDDERELQSLRVVKGAHQGRGRRREFPGPRPAHHHLERARHRRELPFERRRHREDFRKVTRQKERGAGVLPPGLPRQQVHQRARARLEVLQERVKGGYVDAMKDSVERRAHAPRGIGSCARSSMAIGRVQPGVCSRNVS